MSDLTQYGLAAAAVLIGYALVLREHRLAERSRARQESLARQCARLGEVARLGIGAGRMLAARSEPSRN